jgi:hypothetical protein
MKVCAPGEQTIWVAPEEAPWMENKETCLAVRKLRFCLIDSKKGCAYHERVQKSVEATKKSTVDDLNERMNGQR